MNPLFPIENILIFFGAGIALGTYLAWRSAKAAPKKTRLAVTAARCVALAALALVALDPGYWKKIERKTDSEWAVLLDASSSMATRDVAGKTRFEAAAETAEKISTTAGHIAAYPFSSALSAIVPIENLKRLKPDGTGTNIAGAGTALLDKYANSAKSLEGIIVLSDGRETDKKDDALFPLLAKAANAPVYAVVLGGEVKSSNVAISLKRFPKVAFAGQTSEFEIEITNANMGNIEIPVEMFDAAGKKLAAKTSRVENNSKVSAKFKFTPKPSTRGGVEVIFKTPAMKKETKRDDNRVSATVDVIGDKIKALLVEGRPFWDSKFLSQALRENKNIEFTGIYRLTDQRFFFISESGEENKESEHVIFPESLEKLSEYNIVFFGKGAEFFIDEERADILKRYVRDLGGAVVFARGKPYSGEWQMLTALEPVRWGASVAGEFQWTPTAAGAARGLFGDALPPADSPIWRELPPITNIETILVSKSFTETLIAAKNVNDGKKSPALLCSRFGKGMVLAVNSDGLWRWDFFPSRPEARKFYRKFWTRLALWAVKHSDFLPNRDFSIRLSSENVLPGEDVAVLVGARKNTAAPTVRVLSDKGDVAKKIVPSPLPDGRGWSCVISMEKPGRFKIEAGNGKRAAFAVLAVRRPPKETDELGADPEALAKLCSLSGGKTVSANEVLKLVKALRKNNASVSDVTERKWVSIWDGWWFLLVLASAFVLEWVLRRRNGLL